MSVNLSIKNVPNDLADRLRRRAARNHRSLQGELMAILEETLRSETLTIDEAYEQVKRLNFKTEAESVQMIRDDRDGRENYRHPHR